MLALHFQICTEDLLWSQLLPGLAHTVECSGDQDRPGPCPRREYIANDQITQNSMYERYETRA